MHRPTTLRHVVPQLRRAASTVQRSIQPPPPPRFTLPPNNPRRRTPIEQAPQPPSKAPRFDPSAFARTRALPFTLMCAVTLLIGLNVGMVSNAVVKTPDSGIADIANQKDVSGRYDETADTFDSEVGFQEWISGIGRRRREMAAKCTGHVLEVSCGTGRNLGYYDVSNKSKVDSLTFVDLSGGMVEVCKRKWMALHSGNKEDGVKKGLEVRFLVGSAIERMPPPPGGKKGKYDTIVQSMGLCSTPAPVELLTNLVKHLDTSNPDARILLLEHGRSYRDWLNRILDNNAEKHAERYGCWNNRDIGALVEDAAKQAGLEIVYERRRHWGTTWIYELKPAAKAETATVDLTDGVAPLEHQTLPDKLRGWFSAP